MSRPQDVNIWWLPDEVERIIYFNMMTLMLQVPRLSSAGFQLF